MTTHGHPDHSGNTNDFVKATHYTSVFQHQNNRFKLSALFEVSSLQSPHPKEENNTSVKEMN